MLVALKDLEAEALRELWQALRKSRRADGRSNDNGEGRTDGHEAHSRKSAGSTEVCAFAALDPRDPARLNEAGQRSGPRHPKLSHFLDKPPLCPRNWLSAQTARKAERGLQPRSLRIRCRSRPLHKVQKAPFVVRRRRNCSLREVLAGMQTPRLQPLIQPWTPAPQGVGDIRGHKQSRGRRANVGAQEGAQSHQKKGRSRKAPDAIHMSSPNFGPGRLHEPAQSA